jgi:hypothetical protein
VHWSWSLYCSESCIIIRGRDYHRQEVRRGTCNIGYVTKPIGPLKLAKAITQCLRGDSKTATRDPGGPPIQVEYSDLSDIFEELSLGARGGEVFDNTLTLEEGLG